MDEQTQNAMIEADLRRIAQLRDIAFEEAEPRIAALYGSICETLRVPSVSFLFRVLANYPDFLERTWAQVRELAATAAFERAADKLRQHAVPEEDHQPRSRLAHAIRSFNDAEPFVDTVHYAAPKALLIATAIEVGAFAAQDSADAGSVSQASAAGDLVEDKDFEPLPHGIAEGTGVVRLVSEESADERIKAIFASIRRAHGHDIVPSFYRGLANWPEVLETAWREAAAGYGNTEYEAGKRKLIGLAARYVRSWPPIQIDVPADAADDIRSIVRACRLKLIPENMLEVALAKREIDGDRAARVSRFSLTQAAETEPGTSGFSMYRPLPGRR